jgi:hypothetical protein
VSEDQEFSNPTSNIVDKDTLETLAVANNIADVTDAIENMENSEIHSGKNYEWAKRIHEVRIDVCSLFLQANDWSIFHTN